jgi:putative acetyltransferase
MRDLKVEDVNKSDYTTIIDIWEASVRATHHFLKEADIQYFKPLILSHYLDAVLLKCIRDGNGSIIGFSGVADGNLEMLFIHPDFRGMGVGQTLLRYAIDNLDVRKVDVNEQNIQALGFYQKFGFSVQSRSEKDSTGKPYPILHMEHINQDSKSI